MLYKNLPRNVGLRRLTLHKSATGPNVNYILLVECSHFLDNINQVGEEGRGGSSRKTSNIIIHYCRLPTFCRCYGPGYAATPGYSG